MKKPVLYLLLAAVLFTSCATASLSKYRGVGRIKQYDFYSYDVPSAFDGFRIGFASDFHYESRFTRKRLDNAIRALQSLNADVLLLGGRLRQSERRGYGHVVHRIGKGAYTVWHLWRDGKP